MKSAFEEALKVKGKPEPAKQPAKSPRGEEKVKDEGEDGEYEPLHGRRRSGALH